MARPQLWKLNPMDFTKMTPARQAKIEAAPAKALPPTRKRVNMLLPFSMGGAAAELRKTGVVHSEEYTAEGLALDITAEIFVLEKYQEYIL